MNVTVRHDGGTKKQVEVGTYLLHDYSVLVEWSLAGCYEVRLDTGVLWTTWNGPEDRPRPLPWRVCDEDLKKLQADYQELLRAADEEADT